MSQEAIYGRSFDEADGRTLPAETTCPECDGAVATEGGETCCTGCGLIIEEYRIDHTGNLRARFDEEKNEPAPHSLRDDTTGGSRRKSAGSVMRTETLSAEKRRRLNRQRTQHRRAQWRSKAERNLAHACSEIARMVSALELPRFVRESASTTYREAQAADLITGRSIESMAAAAVYATCRCAGFAVSTSEVADVAVCTEDQVNRDYMVLNVELGLETPIVQPESRIPKLATACGLSHTCSTVLMSWRWRPSTMAWRTAGVRRGWLRAVCTVPFSSMGC